MYKAIVNELEKCETIDIRVRSIEGNDFVLKAKPEEKIENIKQEIWNNIGAKTQMNIGDGILDFMSDYVQNTEMSYFSFCALDQDDQIKMLAQSGKFYQLFWRHYMLIFDGHIIEDEATVVGLGFTTGDELAIFPRQIIGKNENLFLQLFLGIKRKIHDVATGVNVLHGSPFGCPMISKEKSFHSHSNPVDVEQCEYELRLLETILMPTFDKIISGERIELPNYLPDLKRVKSMLQLKCYEHSYDCLKDLHDLFHGYLMRSNVLLGLSSPQELEATKLEAERRETIYYSLMELIQKFETSITNVEGTLTLFYSVYIGPSRAFNQYNYSLALPSVQLGGTHTDTTVGDLIDSYKHHIGKENLDVSALIYDGTQYLPYVLVKNIAHKKLQKHYFYFHHDIADDGRDIDELLDFIDGENAVASALPPTPPSSLTPKIKKKRRKNKIPLQRQKSDSFTLPEEAAKMFPQSAEEVDGARSLPIESEEKSNFKLAKSDTDQMSKIWQEYSDKNSADKMVFAGSREYDFDITEEEGGPSDMSLEKAGYLDKLTTIIAAKAQAEWENKKLGFEKLQEENDCIEGKIKEKEKDLDNHKVKVDETIDMRAKEMAKFIGLLSQAEDEKEENVKKVGKLDMEIADLQAKILQIKEEQKALNSKCQQCDEQADKLEKKRKKLEKYMESEMTKVIGEGDIIKDDIQKLKDKLTENAKATEDLANSEIPKTEVVNPPKENTSRLLDFMAGSIKEKENDLECPVCFETADVPIFMCSEMHLICSSCYPKIRECPECRVPYIGAAKRHRYAEKTAEELRKLRKEYENMSC
eukprot:GFUD01028875.1.p1 GENE.GFUD01028875.1~~GFUD01028875.1.p1  ORF type:complete len:813 (-),score=199.48 GFUD01028875.1:264-2702(-)